MTPHEMKLWQAESIQQALDLLEGEELAQWAGYVTFGGQN